MSLVHSTAIIHDGARIGEGTTIGPYSVIGPKVVLGKNNRIGPHVVIEGNTTIGDDNTIFQFASIGSAPQDLKYRGEDSTLTLGNKNIVREYVTLQPGTAGGGMKTQIGNGNLFMANSHVGHDGVVGDGNVIANSAALAGHVTVGNFTTVGGLVGIHQFVRVGDLAILAAGSMVNKDIPPFCSAQGDRCGLVGINRIGLERRGYSKEDVMRVKKLYRELFASSSEGKSFMTRVNELRPTVEGFEAGSRFIDFLLNSPRGITPARSRHAASPDDD